MFHLFENPMFMTVVVGPIAGFFWSQFLNGKQNKEQSSRLHDQSVDLSGANINNSGNLQAGNNNRISNVTHHYQAPKPTAGNGEGEMVLTGMVSAVVTLTYLTYPFTSLLVSLASVLFCLVFSLCYRETIIVKLYKSALYGVLLYSLLSIWRHPIEQQYLDVISGLQGGGLKAYWHFVVSGLPGLPMDVFILALQNAAALLLLVVASHCTRVIQFSGSFQQLAAQVPSMAMFVFLPMFILNYQEASRYVFQMIW